MMQTEKRDLQIQLDSKQKSLVSRMYSVFSDSQWLSQYTYLVTLAIIIASKYKT